MLVKTLFCFESQFTPGEVEIKLMPGIPHLQVVGQPDAHIRECGLKLKSALRTCGFEWPQGHQIVVNLRPAHFRKSSSGTDLAIALAFLALTNQLAEPIRRRLSEAVVYGEISLTGRVYAPPDLPAALRATCAPLITGEPPSTVEEGEWLQLTALSDFELVPIARRFAWDQFWRDPQFPDMDLHPTAFEVLCLVAHMGLHALVAGPHGSGKSTWAKALYALTPPPIVEEMRELKAMFGEGSLESHWRPYEAPHHTITPQAMVGGGAPLFPGVISRAHGGLLVMDEFLEFNPMVLEGLREPLENGFIEHARRGERARFPTRFQLVATTNLCPCGRLKPEGRVSCPYNLPRCRSVIARLSGPIMDRFDLVVFSHMWLRKGARRPFSEARALVRRLNEFRNQRGVDREPIPEWACEVEHSHRRTNALLRVARGLADMEFSPAIEPRHFLEANKRVVEPMNTLRQLFG